MMTGSDNEQVTLQLFCRTALFSLHFNSWHKVAVFAWQKPVSSAQYRQGMLWLNEYVLTNRIRYVLLDYRKTSSILPADNVWATATFSHTLSASTIERVAYVCSAAADPGSTTVQQHMERQLQQNLCISGFTDDAPALAWLIS
ncbi:hypothetical protein [Pontibacter chitinilyticus]|uniref:hypothetical protein n=1 Tax=Pontibacter chitinilyticus TaxID=2674989 RepID=UPI00321A8E01